MKQRRLPVDLPEGYVEFYKKLESWQNEQEISLKKQYTFEEYDILSLLAASNKSLLRIKDLQIKAEDYRNIFQKLCKLIAELRPETADTMQKIAENIDEIDFAELNRKIIRDDEAYFTSLADTMDVSAELLLFTADHSLRPFLRLYAAPYQKALLADEFQSWDFPTICPVCGAKPHVSRLRSPDGRRFMFCDRCFSEWEARYLACVHCGNNEPGTVKYINIENDEAYQIYTCEKCKGYLKTYDERQSGRNTDLFITNIETIYLDMLAQEKGYSTHDMD